MNDEKKRYGTNALWVSYPTTRGRAMASLHDSPVNVWKRVNSERLKEPPVLLAYAHLSRREAVGSSTLKERLRARAGAVVDNIVRHATGSVMGKIAKQLAPEDRVVAHD
eukprot:CAMPEP_0115876960 /NCGR_PEP_ID=MMETSP0287-20121206/25958_1 /TAXON_ID=412157 /ORGANISM="Chrysochromulina rotalis, Strain UIO044" /LENGTH=108 /DNA_ID=CAMNT_0003332423 /DNA_START=643 /DNA_END=968 /DNA_ORIENTATION=+